MKQYRHIASLSPTRGLRWVVEMGTRSYRDIFIHREADEQFAVLFDPRDNKYLCVDMSATHWSINTLEIFMPEPLVFPTEDAAVMAARMKL